MSLEVAVAIALKNEVALPKIREWSKSEGYEDRYGAFLAELGRVRRASRAPGTKKPHNKK